jgi:hypothetical protein
MRSRHKGWIVPNEEIPTLLQQIEAKIASSGINLQQRDTLIRLRFMLEEDLSEAEQREKLPGQVSPSAHNLSKGRVSAATSTLDN